MAKKKKEKMKELEEPVKTEGIFSGIGKMVSSILNLTDRMLKSGQELAERKEEIETKIGGKPARISYGYRIGIGPRPGARAREEFRPYVIKKAVKAEEKIEEWRPVLDIFDKPQEIKVVADLPKGTKKKNIKIEVEGDRLKIITPKYSREAQLPCSVGNWSSKLYKTVLEIKLKKKKK